MLPPESNSHYTHPRAIGGPTPAELRIDVLEAAVKMLLKEHHTGYSSHVREPGAATSQAVEWCSLCRLVERALKP